MSNTHQSYDPVKLASTDAIILVESGTGGLTEPLRIDDNPSSMMELQNENLHQSLPDRYTIISAFLAVSPSILYMFYKMKLAALLYFLLLFSSIPLAIKLQDAGTYWRIFSIRWIVGFVVVALLSGIKTAMIMTVFQNDHIAMKGLFYAHTALWECSNCVLIFGGRSALEKYQITSYSKGIVAALCPAQIKFLHNNHSSNMNMNISNNMMTREEGGRSTNDDSVTTTIVMMKRKWEQKSIYLCAYIVTFLIFRYLLKSVLPDDEIPMKYAIFEAEGIVIYISILVNIWNVPAHIFQFIMMKIDQYRSTTSSSSSTVAVSSSYSSSCPLQVIYPYGAIYLSKSSRKFWSRWSRPASSMIRHMFYYPLGGSSRAWLSIPIMFLLNASSHYSVSEAIMGSRSEIGWNTVFGILGLASTLEVLGNRYVGATATTSRIVNEQGMVMDIQDEPKWWKWIKLVVAAASLRFAAYTLVHGCFDSTLVDLL